MIPKHLRRPLRHDCRDVTASAGPPLLRWRWCDPALPETRGAATGRVLREGYPAAAASTRLVKEGARIRIVASERSAGKREWPRLWGSPAYAASIF